VPNPTESRHLPIDASTLRRLRAAAQHFGVPLKSLFLAMHGWSLATAVNRDTDIVTGLVTNGRPEIPGGDHLVGLFLNTVPVRLRSTGGSWAERARHAWEVEQNLLAHRRFPLSAIERELGRAAFDVSFNFTHFHSYRQLAGLDLAVDSWWSYDKASFPLGIDVMIDAPDLGTGMLVAFDPELISGQLVDGYVSSLRYALASVAEPALLAPVPVAGA
jgi:non-ribosomal peptide synthetase component F